MSYLMSVLLDVDAVQADGYTFPDCFLRGCNVRAENEIDALSQFRKKSGFRLHAKYLKITNLDTDEIYTFQE